MDGYWCFFYGLRAPMAIPLHHALPAFYSLPLLTMRLRTSALIPALLLPLAAQTEPGSKPGITSEPTLPRTDPIPRGTSGPGQATRASRKAEQFQAERLSAREARLAEARRKARAKAEAIKNGTLNVAEVVVPAESASAEKLPGSWVLQSESLGRSLTEQFQKSAGKGMSFKLGKLSGEYLAEIDSDKSEITIHWRDWKMESVAKRDDLKVTLAVSVIGKQHYKIVKLTDGANPASRKMLLELTKDETNSQTFFEGRKIRSRVDLPSLPGGHWAISEGVLHLQGIRQKVPWKFERQPEQ